MLAVLDLHNVELAPGTADEVDLPTTGCLPDVEALRQDESLDQPLGGFVATQESASDDALNQGVLVEGESWGVIDRDSVEQRICEKDLLVSGLLIALRAGAPEVGHK